MRFLTAALSLVATLSCLAQAAEPINLGLNYPRTGSYKKEGLAQMRGALLAIDEINAQGGVLGRPLHLLSKDDASRPEKALRNIDAMAADGAAMFFGGASSAVAIAAGERAAQKKLLYFGTLTYSNDTTGKDGQRYLFRECNSAWMSARALGSYLNRTLPDKRYFYVTANYTWGLTTESSLRHYTGTEDAARHPSIKVPFPGARLSDYRDALTQAAASKADVLVLALFGEDLVHAMRIADELGLTRNHQIIAPNLTQSMVELAGPGLMQGVIGTEPWTWQVPAREGSARGQAFVRDFTQRYGVYPASSAASAYSIVYQWADAAKRSGSLDSDALVKALEGHRYSLLKGEQQWRDFDHQNIQRVYVVKVKPRDEVMRSPLHQDYFEIVEHMDGPEAAPTLAEWQAERRAAGKPLTLQ